MDIPERRRGRAAASLLEAGEGVGGTDEDGIEGEVVRMRLEVGSVMVVIRLDGEDDDDDPPIDDAGGVGTTTKFVVGGGGVNEAVMIAVGTVPPEDILGAEIG